MAFIGNTQLNQNYVPAVDFFSGNGSTTAFTLSRPVASVAAIQAVISNVPQDPGTAFTVSGSTITFTSAPPSGTNNIYVYYTSPNTQVVQPGQGTVGIASFTASGTPDATTYLRGDNTWASAGFASGTLMLFQQTAAPTGWTKQTTHNDKALRVVSGTASSGGTTAFTTVFANQTPTITTSGLSAGATTLSTTQMPSHSHSYTNRMTGSNYPNAMAFDGATYWDYNAATTTATGGGGSHTHSISGSATSSAITLNVQYVDLIIASKD